MVHDLIIVGGDSAGLSAGIYAGRKKMKALILAKKIGGQSFFADSVENYPGFLEISGQDLISRMKEQVEKFGVPIQEEEVVSISKNQQLFLVKIKNGEFRARAVVIASGSHWKTLDVPGERGFIGKGVSVCAICDAPFFGGKDVAVIGGGNAAFESAYSLLKYASKVYIVQHADKFIGDQALRDKLEKSGKVQFLANAETKEIKGDKTVDSLIYEDLKTGKMVELKVGGVFINIGRLPNSSFVGDFLELNRRGEIVIDHQTNAASVPGIFAAGDVTDIKYKQLIVAAAEGAKAALSAYEYLSRY